MNPNEAREFVRFLLNGLKAFYPKIFNLGIDPKDPWEGLVKNYFTSRVLEITLSDDIIEAKNTLELWLAAPENIRNVPLVIIEAAKDLQEVSEATTPESRASASEALLSKTSNLEVELEASSQIVPKPPSPISPDIETPPATPLPQITRAPAVSIGLRTKKTKSPRPLARMSPNLKSLAALASSSPRAVETQIARTIKAEMPQTPREKAQQFAQDFVQRIIVLNALRENASAATTPATLKTLAENRQVLPTNIQPVSTELAQRAVEQSEENKAIAKTVLSKQLPEKEIDTLFNLDNLEYEVAEPGADTINIKLTPYVNQAVRLFPKKKAAPAFIHISTPLAMETNREKLVEEIVNKIYQQRPKLLIEATSNQIEKGIGVISTSLAGEIIKKNYTGDINLDTNKVLAAIENHIQGQSINLAGAIKPLSPLEPSTTEPPIKIEKEVTFIEPVQEIQTPALASEEKDWLIKTIKLAKEKPNALVEEITLLIKKNIPKDLVKTASKEQIEITARLVAIDFVVKLRDTPSALEDITPAHNPKWIFASLVNPENPELKKLIPDKESRHEFAKRAQELALAFESDDKLTRTLLTPIAGKNILDVIYGHDEPVEYKIVGRPSAKTLEVNLNNLLASYRAYQQTGVYESLEKDDSEQIILYSRKALKYLTDNTPWYKTKGLIGKIIAPFRRRVIIPVSTAVAAYSAPITLPTFFAARKIPLLIGRTPVKLLAARAGTFTSLSKPFIKSLINLNIGKFSLKVAIASHTGKTAMGIGIKTAVKETLKTIVLKGALGKAISGIISAISSIGGPIGTILGYLGGELLVKGLSWLSRKIRENKEMVLGGAAVAAGVALATIPALAIPAIVLVGGGMFTMLGAGTIKVAGISGVAASAGGIMSAFMVGITTFVIAFAGPFLVSLLTIIVLTALVLFIINSGAYIVPPGGFSPPGVSTESPYIRVEKEPNPKGPFKNNKNISVNYKITIIAKRGTLENIEFKYECKVFANYDRGCPPAENIIAGTESGQKTSFTTFQDAIPQIISSVDPYIITYSVSYQAGLFNDSLVTDSLTVGADSEGVRSSAIGIASIIIGNPPTGCFTPAGNWPSQYEANLLSAITTLTTKYSSYTAKVCTGGNIPICFDSTPHTNWGWHSHRGSCDITLYSGGLANPSNATYILAHEAGHHLSTIQPTFMSAYMSHPANSERPLCSYPDTTNVHEGFAESIALYTSLPSYWTGRCGNTTYQAKYPNSYQFVSDKIFR